MTTDRAKRVLSHKFVQGLKYDPKGRNQFWDMEEHRFGVQISKSGYKGYILYVRIPGSKSPTRLPVGNADDMGLAAARAKAKQFKELIAEGKDPRAVARQEEQEAQRSKRITFSRVAEDWFADVLAKQRQGKDVKACVQRELIPLWGTRPITDITPLDVRDVITKLKQRAPAQARNLLGTAKRLFGWAVDQGAYGIDASPAERWKAKVLIGKKQFRTRVLNDSELRALWHAAGKLGYPLGPMFKMLMLTGQRRNEVAGARWREIDLGKKLWIIPAARMKGDVAHVVPLTKDVLKLLATLPRYREGDHLFTTTFGTKAFSGFSMAKRKLDKEMAAELPPMGGFSNAAHVQHSPNVAHAQHSPFVVHDIRRTMRTGLSALPIPDNVRELVIAHAPPGLHKIYDQWEYLKEKREALDLWEKRLRSIVK